MNREGRPALLRAGTDDLFSLTPRSSVGSRRDNDPQTSPWVTAGGGGVKLTSPKFPRARPPSASAAQLAARGLGLAAASSRPPRSPLARPPPTPLRHAPAGPAPPAFSGNAAEILARRGVVVPGQGPAPAGDDDEDGRARDAATKATPKRAKRNRRRTRSDPASRPPFGRHTEKARVYAKKGGGAPANNDVDRRPRSAPSWKGMSVDITGTPLRRPVAAADLTLVKSSMRPPTAASTEVMTGGMESLGRREEVSGSAVSSPRLLSIAGSSGLHPEGTDGEDGGHPGLQHVDDPSSVLSYTQIGYAAHAHQRERRGRSPPRRPRSTASRGVAARNGQSKSPPRSHPASQKAQRRGDGAARRPEQDYGARPALHGSQSLTNASSALDADFSVVGTELDSEQWLERLVLGRVSTAVDAPLLHTFPVGLNSQLDGSGFVNELKGLGRVSEHESSSQAPAPTGAAVGASGTSASMRRPLRKRSPAVGAGSRDVSRRSDEAGHGWLPNGDAPVDLSAAPASIIPTPFHKFARSPVVPMASELVAKEEWSFNGQSREFVRTEFPSMAPSGRREVFLLERWLHDTLESEIQRDMSAREVIETAQTVYSATFHELVRQVSVHCAERGALLVRVWRIYLALFDRLMAIANDDAEAIQAQRDEAVGKLESSLKAALDRQSELLSEHQGAEKARQDKVASLRAHIAVLRQDADEKDAEILRLKALTRKLIRAQQRSTRSITATPDSEFSERGGGELAADTTVSLEAALGIDDSPNVLTNLKLEMGGILYELPVDRVLRSDDRASELLNDVFGRPKQEEKLEESEALAGDAASPEYDSDGDLIVGSSDDLRLHPVTLKRPGPIIDGGGRASMKPDGRGVFSFPERDGMLFAMCVQFQDTGAVPTGLGLSLLRQLMSEATALQMWGLVDMLRDSIEIAEADEAAAESRAEELSALRSEHQDLTAAFGNVQELLQQEKEMNAMAGEENLARVVQRVSTQRKLAAIESDYARLKRMLSEVKGEFGARKLPSIADGEETNEELLAMLADRSLELEKLRDYVNKMKDKWESMVRDASSGGAKAAPGHPVAVQTEWDDDEAQHMRVASADTPATKPAGAESEADDRPPLKPKKRSSSMSRKATSRPAAFPVALAKLFGGTISRAGGRLPKSVLLRTIQQIYRDKIAADEDEEEDSPTQTFVEYVYDWFLHKYGLRKLAEQHLTKAMAAVKRHRSTNLYIDTFGRLMGSGDNPLSQDAQDVYQDLLAAIIGERGPSFDYGGKIDASGLKVSLASARNAAIHVLGQIISVDNEAFRQFLSELEGVAVVDGQKHTAFVDQEVFLTKSLDLWAMSNSHARHVLGALFVAGDVNSDGILTLDEFTAILRAVDAKIGGQKISTMFREAHRNNENIHKEDFVRTCMKFGLMTYKRKRRGSSVAGIPDETSIVPTTGPVLTDNPAQFALLQAAWKEALPTAEKALAGVPAGKDRDNLADRINLLQRLLDESNDASAAWMCYRLVMMDLRRLRNVADPANSNRLLDAVSKRRSGFIMKVPSSGEMDMGSYAALETGPEMSSSSESSSSEDEAVVELEGTPAQYSASGGAGGTPRSTQDVRVGSVHMRIPSFERVGSLSQLLDDGPGSRGERVAATKVKMLNEMSHGRQRSYAAIVNAAKQESARDLLSEEVALPGAEAASQ